MIQGMRTQTKLFSGNSVQAVQEEANIWLAQRVRTITCIRFATTVIDNGDFSGRCVVEYAILIGYEAFVLTETQEHD